MLNARPERSESVPTAADDPVTAPRVEVGALGPLRLSVDRCEIEITRAAQRRVLAILIHAGGRAVATGALIDRMWSGSPPASARTALQTHISGVRRLLPDGFLQTLPQGYSFETARCAFDVRAIERSLDEAIGARDADDWSTAEHVAAAALELVRGDPYHELEADDFATGERLRVAEIITTLREVLLESQVESGHAEIALGGLEQLVADHPVRERGWEMLARARSASGRTAEALRAVHDAKLALAEAGLMPPTSLQQLESELLTDDPASAESAERHNVRAPLTRFIGRQEAIEQVTRELEAHRLVTIRGTGGAGKTRLAREIVRQQVDQGRSAWFVDLAIIDESSDVAGAVASAVGLRSDAPTLDIMLRDWASSSTALLVLDNCEHLLGPAARVARFLVEYGPSVTVVATSRRPLGVAGESVIDLPPFALVDAGAPLEEIERNDGVKLFVDRARLIGGIDRLTPETAPMIASICHRVGGLPLAIELAAARTRHLGLATIDARLGERFDLLTSADVTVDDRHRTLAAAVGWSHRLLDPDVATLLRRVSVIRGNFNLADAVAVADVSVADAIEALGSLVDHSLVAFDPRRGGQYRLIEPVREFAADELVRTGDGEGARERHLASRAQCCIDLEPSWLSTGLHEAIHESRDLVDDLSALVDDAGNRDRPEVARIALHLGRWNRRDFQHDRAAHYLRLAGNGTLDDPLEAERLSLLGRELWAVGRSTEAWETVCASKRIAERLPDSVSSAAALCRYGNMRLNRLALDEGDAVESIRAGVAMAERLGDPAFSIRASGYLASALAWTGHSDEAMTLIADLRGRSLALGDRAILVEVLAISGHVYRLADPENLTIRRALLDDITSLVDLADVLIDQDGGVLPLIALELDDVALARRMVVQLERQLRPPSQPAGTFILAETILRRIDGDVDGAWAAIEPLLIDCNEHRAASVFGLATELAVDRGELGTAHDLVARFEAYDIAPSQLSKLSGPLAALVRGEVAAAMSTGSGRHAEAARRSLERLRTIMRDHPPRAAGTRDVERPLVHLLIAEAEVASLDGRADLAWQAVADRATFAYNRAYATERRRRSA